MWISEEQHSRTQKSICMREYKWRPRVNGFGSNELKFHGNRVRRSDVVCVSPVSKAVSVNVCVNTHTDSHTLNVCVKRLVFCCSILFFFCLAEYRDNISMHLYTTIYKMMLEVRSSRWLLLYEVKEKGKKHIPSLHNQPTSHTMAHKINAHTNCVLKRWMDLLNYTRIII